MCAQVAMAVSQSSSFPVEVGVKQGCVPVPIIFNQLLVAITLVSHRDLQSSDCVGIEYRLGGGLFSQRHLQANTKTSSAVIYVLQYTDDAAFPSLTADGLQHSLDIMSEIYLRAGSIINTTKTEIHTASPDAQTLSISRNQLKSVNFFLTWAQICHFLATSQMRSKDALTLLHQPLAVWVNMCLVTKISRYTQRLLSMMQSSSPPSYMAARHGSHTVVISGYWSLFTSDVSS